MTIALLWGRHLSRPKKGVHPRSSAFDGRNLPHVHTGSSGVLRGYDGPVLNPCRQTSPRPSGSCVRRSSGGDWQGRAGAETSEARGRFTRGASRRPTTSVYTSSRSSGCPSLPSDLIFDLGVSAQQLEDAYVALGPECKAHVHIFGVQRSLDLISLRLCLDDIGLACFSSGVICRRGTTIHIDLPVRASQMVVVHGVALVSRALKRAYGWRCVMHTNSQAQPVPLQPGALTSPHLQLQQRSPPPALHTSHLQLSVGTWNVEGLTSARKQLELASVLHAASVHIVAVQESHERVDTCIDVPRYRWFGRPRQQRRKGGVGFLVLESLVPEIEVIEDATHPESMWLRVRGYRGQQDLFLGCVYMAPVVAATMDRHYEALVQDVAAFQRKGQVLVMGDFNARVGSATSPMDVIGQYGEDVCNRDGARLIDLLHASDLYCLNGRQPLYGAQPAWTRCRASRGEQSIIDYIIGDSGVVSSGASASVHMSDISDHYLIHTHIAHTARVHRARPTRPTYRFRPG